MVGSDSTRYYGKGVYLETTECKQLRAVNVEDTFPAPAQKNKEMEPILKQQASNTALELIWRTGFNYNILHIMGGCCLQESPLCV